MDLVLPGQSDRVQAAQDHHYKDQLAVSLGGEYRWSDLLSVVVGGTWTSATITSVDVEEVRSEVFDLGFGLT